MLKKIRIQRVSIFDIVATLVLAVVLVAFAVQGTGELAQMQTATDDYIQCETLARQLQSGSDYLIEQVAARGLQGFFTELLGLADIYGVSKVQLGTDYLRRTGIDPAHCVMIGDTQHDAEVAAAIGAKCVLYTGGHQSRARLEKASPYVIDDLAQLPALLETI